VKDLTTKEFRSLALQGVINLLGAWGIYTAYQLNIKPDSYVVILYFVHLALYAIQWKVKMNITIIFIILIGWTLIGVTNWPDLALLGLKINDYALSLGAIAMALSGWIMHSFNKSRW